MPFARFIKSAALNHGELINFTNISNDSGVPVSTVKEYYKVLEDTLVGFCLEPWLESKKRKAIATAKFYFFDNGVAHRIVGIENLDRHSNLWGKAFEQFLINELRAYDSYHQKRKKFHFWRSVNKQEVDMIINNQIAIEIKSATKVTEKHLLGLKALKEEKIIKEFYLVSEDKLERQTDGIHIQHWKSFLKKLWNGEIF